MKRKCFLMLMLVFALTAAAQKKTLSATHYKEFRPSVVTLRDGRRLNQPLTNVFLKNSSLLYLKGEYTMEANMDNIISVDFDDRSYVAINKQLAYLVDSVGTSRLYCIELFDQESYERNLKNNVNISSLSLGEMVSSTTVDLNADEDYKLPIFEHYYIYYDGGFVRVHERELSRRLSKEQRTMMKRIAATPGFSWQDRKSLMMLLKAITKE